MKFEDTGELIYLSESFSLTNSIYGKFMNNDFYVIFNDYDENELKMWYFDLDGNSLSGENPIVICSLGNYNYYKFILDGENYFYCISDESEGIIELQKCDYEGNVLAESTINTLVYAYILAYDQDQDFISISGYTEDDEYQNYLIEINDSGASDPIFYLPEDLITAWFCDKYYIENGFSMSGIVQGELKTISTLRKQDAVTEINTIREIEYEMIYPNLVKRTEGVAAYWYSSVRNSIMIQLFNEDGEPQYETNGSVLIEDETNFTISDNVIYTYKIDYTGNTEDTVSINAFSLSGEPLWSSAEQFSIISGYRYITGIASFYNGHLFYAMTNLGVWPGGRRIELMYFDENGLIWDQAVFWDVSGSISYNSPQVKGNNLHYRCGDEVYSRKINEDGTYEEEILLADNSDLMQIYGNEDDFFVLTRDGITSEREFHYFHEGNLVWEEPWVIYIDDYRCLNPIFSEEFFYLTGFNYPDSINVHQFDYDHNFIEENSFSFTSYNPIVRTLHIYNKSEKFLFFINSRLANYENRFSYTIYDEAGNQLVPEFTETIMDRPHMEAIKDIEFVDENAYLLLSCGYKPMEGEYERNYYVQKIDLSDFVGISNENIANPNMNLSVYPNPFNPSTTVSFEILNDADVKLEVFNIKGQKVKEIVNNEFDKGSHLVVWNGVNKSNKSVGSGIYFFKLSVNGKSKVVKKCLLLK
ncbi:MAG: T9SS type A sorting domain-containing protein [Candidatus Cloacimonetes bacterium]|nr:T9SS type A sorting domain-containing protein [Candidatus Cloacimonadota bacterium]